MRIVGGRFRGRRLASLGKGDPAAHLRPTTDRVRESLFNILGGGRFGDPVAGALVLDLFAGTGALGLEALSRGAAFVSFVENGRKGQGLITENVRTLGAGAETRLIRSDARRLPVADTAATLIFIDPPYGQSLGEPALAATRERGWIAPGALVVWEESAPMAAPEGFALLETRRFGDSHVTFLEATGE